MKKGVTVNLSDARNAGVREKLIKEPAASEGIEHNGYYILPRIRRANQADA